MNDVMSHFVHPPHTQRPLPQFRIPQLDREVTIGETFDANVCEFPVHEAAEKFPPMDDEQFYPLVDSIASDGLREPILLLLADCGHLSLLDGRNRTNALLVLRERGEPKKTKYKVVTVEYLGTTPERFVIACNLERRHLTKSQRAMIAARDLQLFADLAKHRMRAGRKIENGEKGKATDLAGKYCRVSGELVRYAQKLFDRAHSGLIEAVDAGWLYVSTASKLCKLEDEQIADLLIPPQIPSHLNLDADEASAYRIQIILKNIRSAALNAKSPSKKKRKRTKSKRKYPEKLRPVVAQANNVRRAIGLLESLWAHDAVPLETAASATSAHMGPMFSGRFVSVSQLRFCV